MSDNSAIEWCDSSWNPIRGQNARHTCARISPGCDNCYAATMTRRGLGGTAPIDYGRGEKPNDPARLDESALMQPHRLPRDFLSDAPFTVAGKYRVIGNGVPIPMGRAIARAVRRAIGLPIVSEDRHAAV